MGDWMGAAFELGAWRPKAPVVQGGMGIGVSMSRLASAVANEGGIGVVSAAGIGMLCGKRMQDGCGALKTEIAKARALTKGVLGVNIMTALSNFDEMAKTAIAERIDVIFAGAGLPLNLPQWLTPGSKTCLVPIVSSARAAETLLLWWHKKFDYTPDGFVVEGPMAGGHLGFRPEQLSDPAFSLERLVEQVLSAVGPWERKVGKKIPVIAAGGIFTGDDIARFLKLGASAVQMATRFVATQECDASLAFKKAYIACRKEESPSSKARWACPDGSSQASSRAGWRRGRKSRCGCPYHCITSCKQQRGPYCISQALLNACRGKLREGFAFIGANGWRVAEITTVRHLMEELCEQYRQAAYAVVPPQYIEPTRGKGANLRRVVITGLGVVSPVGNSVGPFWNSLTQGKCGIGFIRKFDTADFKVKIAAEVKDFDPTCCMDKTEARRTDPFVQYALAAAAEAMADSGLADIDPARLGVYVGSGIGGITTLVAEQQKLMEKGPSRISPFFIPMMIGNMASGSIAIRYRAKGPACRS